MIAALAKAIGHHGGKRGGGGGFIGFAQTGSVSSPFVREKISRAIQAPTLSPPTAFNVGGDLIQNRL